MPTHRKNYISYADEVKRKIDRGMNRNLDMAAITYVSLVTKSFGNSGQSGSISGATQSQRAANRSRPGEPPHVDTGHLRRNVGWSRDTTTKKRKIGTGIGNKDSVGYAVWLEFGTSRMAARPFLRPPAKTHRNKLRKIMAQPVI
jgi:HK97 gp10 family phage protein